MNASNLVTQKLLKKAKSYLHNTYAPYSKIRVVAVLETEKGVFIGTNIENASYSLTICAERTAFFKAISEGARRFYRILIYSPDITPYPCGACRQVMSEFVDDDFEVIICSENKKPTLLKFAELFPYRFSISETYDAEYE